MFNRRFHEIRAGLRVFGRSISFVEVYVNHRDDRAMRVALRNDSDVIIDSNQIDTRYAALKASGMIELYDGYLINPDNVAYVQLDEREIRLSFEGKEGTKVLVPNTKNAVNRVNPYRAELPGDDFVAIKATLSDMQGEIPDSYENLQETVEGLILQVINLEAGLIAVNSGLSSGSLQANSIQVG